MRGYVKSFPKHKKYGFIRSDGVDYYIANKVAYRGMKAGDQVVFRTEGNKVVEVQKNEQGAKGDA